MFFQVLHLEPNEKKLMLEHLAHTTEVHDHYYKQTEATLSLSKVARVLVAVEAGNVHEWRKRPVKDSDVTGKYIYHLFLSHFLVSLIFQSFIHDFMFSELEYREEEMAGVVEPGEAVFSSEADVDDPDLDEDVEEALTNNARMRTIDSIDDEMMSHDDMCEIGVHSKEPSISKHLNLIRTITNCTLKNCHKLLCYIYIFLKLQRFQLFLYRSWG